jgi:hypothetical protein
VTAPNHVLLIGFDPHSVPGVDANLVDVAMAMGDERLKDAGFHTTYCLVAPDDAAESQITEALSRQPYDCVVVGGGIRKPPEFLELFERVVNLIRVHAPAAAIAFNSTGADSVDAVRRWLPSRSG